MGPRTAPPRPGSAAGRRFALIRRGRTCIAVVLLIPLAVVLGVAGAAGGSPSAPPGSGRPVDAKRFEPGACMLFAPTAGDRHLRVFLDAGHGGIDPGGIGEDPSGRPVQEADETLPVELDAMASLRAAGFSVVVSRTRDQIVGRPGARDISGGVFTPQGVHDDVAARDLCADMARADVLVGIYFDAGASSDNAGSVTGYDRSPVLRPEPASGHLGAERRAGRHERPGVGHPERGRGRRRRAGGSGAHSGRRQLRASVTARPT